MYSLRISARARQDISEVLTFTSIHFGENARLRYAHLLNASMNAILQNPFRHSTLPLSKYRNDLRTCHLRFFRDIARTSSGVVHTPRHLFVYRIKEPHIEMLRLLHDSMIPERHLVPFIEPDES
jgi:toxin ParE1/3/4